MYFILFIVKDLKEYVSEQIDGGFIFEQYEKDNVLSDHNRKLFIKYVVQQIILKFGHYPSHLVKVHYAKLCVELFPAYRNSTADENHYVSNFLLILCIFTL